MSFTKRVLSVARHPMIGVEYLSWVMQRQLLRREPIRLVHNVKLGKFADFSEYHWAPLFVNEDALLFLTKHVVPDGQIIDIGANMGLITLLLAKGYQACTIHAIEPNPFTFSALMSNIASTV